MARFPISPSSGLHHFHHAHRVEQVVKISEKVQLRVRFRKQRLHEGRYAPGQIDARWVDEIKRDFSLWLATHIDELPVLKAAIQELLVERTW